MDPATVAAACLTEGLTMTASDGATVHVPLTLQPFAVSRGGFEGVMATIQAWNRVIDRVARDTDFVLATLEGGDEEDELSVGLLRIYRELYHDAAARATTQPAMLGIFRSDYMLTDPQRQPVFPAPFANTDPVAVPWRHVEINTIACAFSAMSTRAGRVHAATMPRPVVQSQSESGVIAGLVAAATLWARKHSADAGATPALVFVVKDDERNVGDQRLLAEGIRAAGVRTIRRSLTALCRDGAALTNGHLVIPYDVADGDAGVAFAEGAPRAWAASVLYMRSLYGIEDFGHSDAWAMRRSMEQSTAVKCPSVGYHLCTMKRMQCALADPATLRRYTDTDAECEALMATTMPLVPLTAANADAAMADAVEHPERWVLKAETEATGFIVAGQAMVDLLKEKGVASPPDCAFRKAHLLMGRIASVRRAGKVLRGGEAHDVPDLECELGAFGVILSEGGDVVPVHNELAGYLLRTKGGSHEGGGIMSGISCIDTVTLE